MTRYVKTAALLAVLIMASAALSGCNTFRGAGTDIKRGGEAMEGAAVSVPEYSDVRRNETVERIAFNSSN